MFNVPGIFVSCYHIIQEYDIVVDGCDNFATRYLINDICIEQKKSACELYRSPLFFLFTHWFERIHSLPGQKVDTKLV